MMMDCRGTLALVLLLSWGQALAGEKGTAVSAAPVCHRSDSRSGQSGAVRVQGALLQTAALSVASGAVGSSVGRRQLKNLPRRHQSRWPSWYTRAQAARLRGQQAAVAAVSHAVPSSARTRVRESSGTAGRSAAGGVRSPPRPQAVALKKGGQLESPSSKASWPRPQARGARHRRLVQESLDALDEDLASLTLSESARGSDGALSASAPDPEATGQGRQARSLSPAASEPAVLTRHNLKDIQPQGIYRINVTQDADLVLFDSTCPNITRINLTLVDSHIESRGDLVVFACDLSGIPAEVSIQGSTLVAGKKLHLIGARAMQDCDISVNIGNNSHLDAKNGDLGLVAEGCMGFPGGQPLHLAFDISDSQLSAAHCSGLALRFLGPVSDLGNSRLHGPQVQVGIENSNITTNDCDIALTGAWLLGPVDDLHMELSIDKGRLKATGGTVSLVHSLFRKARLDCQINNSQLSSNAPKAFASVVRGMGPLALLDLSMNLTHITAAGTGTRAVASPVGDIRGLDNRVRIHDCEGNRIEAESGQQSGGLSTARAVASLGWAPDQIDQIACNSGATRHNSTLIQTGLNNNTVLARVRKTPSSDADAPGEGGQVRASLAGVFPDFESGCTHSHNYIWYLEQSQLEANRVEARGTRGTSLASLGFMDDGHDSGVNRTLSIRQENGRNNSVNATSAAGGVAVASLVLAEDCSSRCRVPSRSPCLSTVRPRRSPVPVTFFHQCAMEDNLLSADGDNPLPSGITPADGAPHASSRPLLIYGGCPAQILSVSGAGAIRCTSHPCNETGPGQGASLTRAGCRVLACGAGTAPCTQDWVNTSSREAHSSDRLFCENSATGSSGCLNSPLLIAPQPLLPESSAATSGTAVSDIVQTAMTTGRGGSFTPDATVFSMSASRVAPASGTPVATHIPDVAQIDATADSSVDSSTIALASTAASTAVLLPASCAVLATALCVFCHYKGRHHAAGQSEESMEMESLSPGTQAARGKAGAPAAASSGVVLYTRRTCAPLEPGQDDEEHLYDEAHIYDAVDDLGVPTPQLPLPPIPFGPSAALPEHKATEALSEAVAPEKRGYAQLNPVMDEELSDDGIADCGLAASGKQSPGLHEELKATAVTAAGAGSREAARASDSVVSEKQGDDQMTPVPEPEAPDYANVAQGAARSPEREPGPYEIPLAVPRAAVDAGCQMTEREPEAVAPAPLSDARRSLVQDEQQPGYEPVGDSIGSFRRMEVCRPDQPGNAVVDAEPCYVGQDARRTRVPRPASGPAGAGTPGALQPGRVSLSVWWMNRVRQAENDGLMHPLIRGGKGRR